VATGREYLALGVLGALLVAAPGPATAGADDGPRADVASATPRVDLFLEHRLVVPWLDHSLEIGDLEAMDDLLVEPPAAGGPLAGARFRSSFTEKDGTVVPGLQPEFRLFSYQARASWPVGDGAVVSSEADLLGFAGGERVDGPPVAQPPRMAKLHLTGAWAALESGVRVESASPGLETITDRGVQADQEGAEVWVALRLGMAGLRATAGHASDNVLEDRHRPRTTRTEGGLALELKLPDASLFSVGASEGAWVRLPARRATGPESRWGKGELERLFATLYHHGGRRWNASLSTTYTEGTQSEPVGRASSMLSHYLTVSVQPTLSLGITPTLGVSQDDSVSGAGSRTLWASLSVWAAPLAGPIDLTLYADWKRSRTLDDLYDGRSFYAGACLTWHLRRRAPTTALVFEAGYYRFLDAASGSGRYEDVAGQVVFKVAAF
jgi:hypothetical protein